MLCKHLGFEEKEGNNFETRTLEGGENILAGDLICYKKKPSGTSCCTYLKISKASPQSSAEIPYVKCKYIH